MTKRRQHDSDSQRDDHEKINDQTPEGIPYCATHHCQATSVDDQPVCPVEGCACRVKYVNTAHRSLIPAGPNLCQRCGAICERDAVRSQRGFVILRCPSCDWKSNTMAEPSHGAMMLAHHERTTRKPRRERSTLAGPLSVASGLPIRSGDDNESSTTT